MPALPAILVLWLAFLTTAGAMAQAAPTLQALIDAADEDDTVVPPPGTYEGPVRITKPVTLDGRGEVTIDSGGKGSVVIIDTDGATVRGLRLTNSGDQHNDIDAGVQVRGNYNVIKDNVIDDVLFGIDLQQSNNNVVRRNRIGSKKFALGVRGDAVRLWYSRDNRIEDNVVADSRDVVVWYSADNVIAHNEISGGRYGLHFMYSLYNVVEDNDMRGNSVGIFLMYSDGVVVRNNRISHAQGATGMGIGMKESSDVTLAGNTVYYCGTGIYLDVSPFQPDTTNRIESNHIAYNGIGVLFHNDWTGNLFKQNRFQDNYVQVSVNAQASAKRNDWRGNFWDDYQGFDRDADGTGDTPHRMRVYADRLWMDVPFAAFFKGSPVLGLLDFLERLAPFTEPILLLEDDRPRISVTEAKATETPQVDDRDPFGLKTRLKPKSP